MPQGHSHETTELLLLFLNEGLRIEKNLAPAFDFNSILHPETSIL